MDPKDREISRGEYKLEPLSNEDIPLFVELDRQAASYEVGSEYYTNLLKYFGDNIRVVRQNGQIVGAVYVLFYGEDTTTDEDNPYGEVCSINVADEARRQGVGEMLLGFAVDRLKQRGAPRIQLHTRVSNIPMQNLAKKMGFEVVEEIPNFYDAEGENAYLMQLANYQPSNTQSEPSNP